MISIDQALEYATQKLYAVTQRPRFEAEILLCYFLGCDRIRLILDSQKTFDMQGYLQLIEKRATDYPLEYLTHEVSFYDTTLFVKEGVLIARPETELLVDESLKLIKAKRVTKIAEIGIGSGAISVCVAKKCKDIQIIATDINPVALEVAQINIEKHKLSHKIQTVQTSLLEGVDEGIEMVVSNPPYIAKSFELPKNVKYEPHNALFGGEEGDELLKQIVIQAQERGIKYIACEMGYDQKEKMQSFFAQRGITKYRFYKDLAQLDRGFVIEND